MAKFENAIDELLKDEGYYSNDKYDQGGETKFGISKKAYPNEDIKNLTLDRAKFLYKRDYWDANKLDQIESQELADLIFDKAVNSGNKKSIEILQQAANEIKDKALVVDGKIGPDTINVVNALNPYSMVLEFFKLNQLHYVGIVLSNDTQLRFLKGWINRSHRKLNKLETVKPVFTTQGESFSGIWQYILDLFFTPKPKKEIETNLFELILQKNPTIDRLEFDRAFKFLDKVTKKDVMLYVDFDKVDTSERAYLINLKTGLAETFKTTHGKNSDSNDDGIATEFSNVPESYKSSLGAMITGPEYGQSVKGGSKFYYARRLIGLEPELNGNVLKRAIVLHNSEYAETGGRSLGCITFSKENAKKVLDQLGEGSLVYVNHQSLI